MLPRPGQDVPEQTGGHQIRAPWSLDQIAPNSLGSLLPGMPRLMVLTPEVETSEKNSPAQGPLAGTSFTTIVTLVPSRSCVTLSTHDPLWIVPPETNSTPGRRSLTVTLRADPYFKRALWRMQAARISAATMTLVCFDPEALSMICFHDSTIETGWITLSLLRLMNVLPRCRLPRVVREARARLGN